MASSGIMGRGCKGRSDDRLPGEWEYGILHLRPDAPGSYLEQRPKVERGGAERSQGDIGCGREVRKR